MFDKTKQRRQNKAAAHKEKVDLKHKDKYGLYEDGEIVGAIGQNGRLMLLPDRVRIARKGLMSLATQGIKGDKEILIKQIAAIKFKEAKHTTGYIGFDFLGGLENKSGLLDMYHDENAVVFTPQQNVLFQEIKALIEKKMDAAHTPVGQQTSQSSAYDELAKLATLRDQGIVTEQEFQEQKSKLLGTQTSNQSQRRFDPRTGRPL